MSVYVIRNEGFKFKEFIFDQDDYIDLIPEGGEYTDEQLLFFGSNDIELGHWWKNELEATFKTPEGLSGLPTPDIAVWLEAAIVVSEKAYTALSGMLGGCGEFLPVTAGGGRFWVFNCLNYDASKFAYKIKFDSSTQLYCGEELKELCEHEGLTGIKFSTTPHDPFSQG